MSDVRADALGEEESYSVKNGEETISNKGSDRLSAMPDDILIHILSRLGFEVKHPAITCVLSKRWKSLWGEMPTLKFSDCSWDPDKTRDFVSWVHRTIISRSSRSYVDQFSVEFLYNECYASDVNSWIHFALKNEVKDLSVDLHSEGHFYTPPQLLYSDSSLTRMRLQRCVLAPLKKIEWPHLTHLRVEDVELPQEVIQKILSGCPVLYYLCLRSCWGFTNISSASLRELVVSDNLDKNNVESLEISTPGLCSLDVSFSPIEKKLQLTNLPSSLDCAVIDYAIWNGTIVVFGNTIDLLFKTRHTKLLVLGGAFVQVLAEMVMMYDDDLLPQEPRQVQSVQLTLLTSRHVNIIPGILFMLRCSPNVEELVIECIYSDKESARTWGMYKYGCRWEIFHLDCDLLNLKTVRLLNIADPMDGEPMLTMARVLLESAPMLEKMEIKLKDINGGSPDFKKISETVLGYPRSSEKAVIVFQKSADEDP